MFTYHTRYEKYAHYVPLTRALVEAAAVRLSTRFAARADAVIAPSSVVRDELVRRGVRAPVAVVPTGVDLSHFRPANRGPVDVGLGLPEREPVLLYVGRLDREKSVERVLLAFDRIAGDQRIRCLFNLGGATIGLASHGAGAQPIIELNGADPAHLPPCGALWLKLEGKNDA